jgi:hypothetical protein
MARYILLVAVCWLIGCASQKTAAPSNRERGDTRTRPVELIDNNTYLITERTDDATYAFKSVNPVKVGKDSSGPQNERRFLNALLGPNGEEIKYYRVGSCCPFKTPNGIFDNSGMLDHYKVFWTGARDTLDIYINMYDEGDLFIPVGLNAKKKN